MIDQILLLAESGSHAGGVPAPAIGLGMFLALMAALGLTWLASGSHQRTEDGEKHDGERDR